MKKPVPKIYRTTNWSSYNQALIKRGNILIPRPNGMHSLKASMDEIKLIPMQRFNGV
ncbi:hypothetical protein ABSDF0977 [Acinetobacter baumannii SDF]|uniref:Uncharacterized protein n=1 Tax=Acinetobacter baumannii (strain SDF) TaxID=509170 RepID=B0VTP9_ACIBS|nr:hypothetical protein ABSDF0977 [Acinetobacter baumannii SDF]